jgi:hypothetical protein
MENESVNLEGIMHAITKGNINIIYFSIKPSNKILKFHLHEQKVGKRNIPTHY